MTMLNIFVSRDRALVAVDSLRTELLPGGQYRALGHVAKLCHFERACTVMACRGLARMGLYLRAFLGDAAMVDSLDAIDQAMPFAFDHAQAKLLRELRGAGRSWESPQCVRLVGYSRRAGRIVCIAFEQPAPGNPLSREVIEEDTELAPWHELQGDLPVGDTIEGMRAIAAQQIDFQRQLDGAGSTIGGDVVIAEVDKDSVRVNRFVVSG